MKLLIPGGAGYIGSHMVRYAQEKDCEVVVLDNFSTGHEWAVKDCEILKVNLLDKEKLSKLLKGRFFDGVIHFAAKSLVGESIKTPEPYYQNNEIGSLNLVGEMLKNDVMNIVFSSTAAIFGNLVTHSIAEKNLPKPINPYGQSKLMVENILQDICVAHDFNATCLRYFNAAGAHKSGDIGEAHVPETHLIPNILKSALSKDSNLKIYGNDYSTHDGTCVRDYVHVTDLAHAHFLSLKYMEHHRGFSTFNLGNGIGFSVMDIIKSCEKVTNAEIGYKIVERRKGDPDILIADSRLALDRLGWKPKYKGIDSIVESAWLWEKNRLVKSI